jgi:hypothetical protein
MSTPRYRDCPGCGLRLPTSEAQFDIRYNASSECWQRYLDVYADTLTPLGTLTFVHHQLAVDAYGAQHAGEGVRPITVAFALIGLYYAFERGYSGWQVQHMHTLLANRTKNWPRFMPTHRRYALTVADVLGAPPGAGRDEMLRRWGRAVWDAWGPEHARVKSLIEQVMGN